MIVWKK